MIMQVYFLLIFNILKNVEFIQIPKLKLLLIQYISL